MSRVRDPIVLFLFHQTAAICRSLAAGEGRSRLQPQVASFRYSPVALSPSTGPPLVRQGVGVLHPWGGKGVVLAAPMLCKSPIAEEMRVCSLRFCQLAPLYPSLYPPLPLLPCSRQRQFPSDLQVGPVMWPRKISSWKMLCGEIRG